MKKASILLGMFLLGSTAMWGFDLESTKTAAEAGDAEAQVRLGRCYLRGESVEKNRDQAMIWFRKAVEQGNATGQYCLGWTIMYEKKDGTVTIKNDPEGFSLLKKAAEAGNLDAMDRMGLVYTMGVPGKIDNDEALKWYLKAAEAGDVSAMVHCGDLYINNVLHERTAPKEPERAIDWYKKAAGQGSAKAALELGKLYSNGKDVKQDGPAAVKWLEQAAACSSDDEKTWTTRARTTLAEMYEKGSGVACDEAAAARWYRESAMHGDWDGMYHFAQRCETGRGVSQDTVEAYAWYSLAVRFGYKHALVPRAELEEKMSVFDLTKAKVRETQLRTELPSPSK